MGTSAALELDARCAWLLFWRAAALDADGDIFAGDTFGLVPLGTLEALGRHAIRSVLRLVSMRAKTLSGVSDLTARRWVHED